MKYTMLIVLLAAMAAASPVEVDTPKTKRGFVGATAVLPHAPLTAVLPHAPLLSAAAVLPHAPLTAVLPHAPLSAVLPHAPLTAVLPHAPVLPFHAPAVLPAVKSYSLAAAPLAIKSYGLPLAHSPYLAHGFAPHFW